MRFVRLLLGSHWLHRLLGFSGVAKSNCGSDLPSFNGTFSRERFRDRPPLVDGVGLGSVIAVHGRERSISQKNRLRSH
jgi:hypothetical protein